MQAAAARFRVSIEPGEKGFEWDGAGNLLDAARRAGIGLPHSCRTGTCRTCLCRLTTGRVTHEASANLEPQELADGFILPCVARADADVGLWAPEACELGEARPRRFPARVLSVEKLAHDVARVVLQVPATLGFRFHAGQYVDVMLADGARRSYSLANAPAGGHELELHIRHMPGGLFTDRVFSTLKPREMLQLDGPHGSFFLRDSRPRATILLASGTGFAPIQSMVRDCMAANDERNLVLYWGGRRLQDIYRLEMAQAWTRELPDLRFVPVLSEPEPGVPWSGRTGLVHEAVMADFPSLAGCEVYACGAPAMVEAARKDFVATRGLSPDDFIADAFISQRELAQAEA